MKKSAAVTLAVTLLTAMASFGQDFSNKGKDFWVAYGYHQVMNVGNSQEMVLYFATEEVTTVTVTIPLLGYTQTYTNIPANTIFTSNPLPKAGAQDARLINEEISNKGIHITSDKPIVAYAHIYNSNVSGATLLFPTSTLGREYYSVNYTQVSNANNSNTWFYVVAVDPGITTVEIIPSASTQFQSPGVSYTVNLQQGQVYNALGALGRQTAPFTGVDLTGTVVRSVAQPGGTCKRIAVFSGSGRLSISCNGTAPSSDNYMVQAFPKNAWGKKFLTVPTGNMPNNYYRVCVTDPTTQVRVNGTLLTGLFANFYYEFSLNAPAKIESDQPVMVAQYITSQGQCTNGSPGDPEVIYLSPVEQNIDRVITNSTSNFAITQHWINVVIKSNVAGSFRLDGFPVNFQQHPQDPEYMYAMIGGLAAGQHVMEADSGFNATAYGFGQFESYGYNAGTNVKDLYQYISIENEYATVDFPASCKGTPFNFQMTFPYQPTQIRWEFFGLFPNVTIDNPTPDATWVVNGKTLYRYDLPGSYTVPNSGVYPIRVYAVNPTADGCSGEQQIDYDLEIFDPPVADFSISATGCPTDTVFFTDNSVTGNRPVIQWMWDFGDGQVDNTKDTKHKYAAAGTYTISHALITDVGCVSDTVEQTLTLADPPVAGFSFADDVCVGTAVSFTDNSQANTGSTLAGWTWDFGDGSAPVNANDGSAQTHTYTTPGTYFVTLTVITSAGCKSFEFGDSVHVRPLPVADFSFSEACMPDAAVSFTDESTISDGSSPFTYLWNFGDGNTSTDQNPVHAYGAAGPFNTTLTTSSVYGCQHDTTMVVNNIHPQPVAQFSANSSEVCLGADFSFTDQSTSSSGNITNWEWDFGDGTNSTSQNPTKSYGAAGSYEVSLVVTSSFGCISDTFRMNVAVTPPPTASFTQSGQLCEGSVISFISNSQGNNITSYQWFVNGTPSSVTNAQFDYTPGSAGSYDIRLLVTTSGGCTDDTTITINTNAKPLASFATPVICLPAGTAPFTNQTSISDGTTTQLTYLWDFGDGNTSTDENPVHIYSGTGPYNVKLTATSVNGCADDTTIVLSTIYDQPQAAFTAVNEICLGEPLSLTDASTADGSSVTNWTWNFGDGTNSSAQNPTVTYGAAGTYTITLDVVSAVGCPSSQATHTITVNPLPAASFTIADPQCAGEPVSFIDNSLANAGNIISWNWNYGDGASANLSSGAPHNHTYANTGTYNATLQVVTDKGCESSITQQTVTVSPLPVPAFAMPESCLDDPFSQFSDQSTIVDGTESQFSYLWNFDDPNASGANPNTSTDKNPQHRYSVAQLYNVSLTVTSGAGCEATITQPFMVNGAVPQSVFSLQPSGALCSGVEVTLTNNSTVDVGNVVKLEIFWDYANDPTIKTQDDDPQPGKTYNFNYPPFGSPASKTVTVRVVAYSGDNCLHTSTETITLYAQPELAFAPIAGICEDVPAFQLLQAGEINGIPGTGSFSGSGVTADGLFTPALAGPGQHTITYTFISSDNCVATAEQVIPVFALPVADAGPDRFVLEGGNITLLGQNSSGNGINWLWSPPATLDDSSLAVPTATPTEDTWYTLLVTTADGCTATDEVFVEILLKPIIPNAFSPNGDGINDTWQITSLESYPGATVEVFNRYGQMIFRSTGYATPWDGKYKGKDVPVGTYYYIVDPRNGRERMSGFVDVLR